MTPSTALTMELGDQAALAMEPGDQAALAMEPGDQAALADNNNVSSDTVSMDEMELLRKLEEANR